MTSQPSELSRVIAAVELQDVRLVDFAARTTVRSPIEAGDVEIQLNRSATASPLDATENRFLVAAILDMKVGPPGREPVVSLRAVYELTYQLPQGFETTDEALAEFAEVNGTFNAWPYWREFVQTTMARMNLPPFVLPVFRLQPAPRSDDTSSAAPAKLRPRRPRKAAVH